MKVKKAAGLLVFRRYYKEIQYLFLKSSKGDFHWSPPKGGLEKGEDVYTAALRETEEEAGYTKNDLKIFKDESITLEYKTNGKHKIVVYWMAELLDPNKPPLLSHEHTEYRWLLKDEAKELAKYKDFHILIDFFDVKIPKTT